MRGSASGYELNIYQQDININHIKSPDDFFNAVRDIVNSFDENRYGLPTDLFFEDEDYDEIEHQQEVTSDLIKPTKEAITVTHHFTYTDATYTFEYSDNENPIKTKGEKFRGMIAIDADYSEAFIKGGELFDLELQGTSEGMDECTTLFWIDAEGHIQSSSLEHIAIDELDEEQEKELREFTDQLYEEIFK